MTAELGKEGELPRLQARPSTSTGVLELGYGIQGLFGALSAALAGLGRNIVEQPCAGQHRLSHETRAFSGDSTH